MAIRYVAPTFDQPTQREMNERSARQRNLFGAGRNLSRAFVRQAAIDYALQQQAAQRQMQQQPQQPMGQDLATLQQQFQQRAQAGAAERAAQAQLASQPTLQPVPENRPLGFVGGPAVVSPSVPGGGPSVDVSQRIAGEAQRMADQAAAEKMLAMLPQPKQPKPPVATMAGQTLDLTGESQSDRIAREAAARVAEQEQRNVISGRTLRGLGGMVEEYGDADTNVADEFDLAVRRDPATSDEGLDRIRRVLAFARAGGSDKMFDEGGYGVLTEESPSSGLALGVDAPVDFSSLKNRFRPSPNLKESMRLAGIAEKNYAPNKTVEELWGDFDKSEDQASWIIDYLKKEPKNNQWDRGFRASLVRIFAQHFEGPDFRDLSGGTLDLDGRTLQPPDVSNLSREEQNAFSQLQELNYYRKLRETLNRQLQKGDDGLFNQQILGDFLPLNEG
tara:strand:- start:13115 stop:14452 length:1338 start_codon:yes stop_codon:yes gene_type:complete